MGLEDFTDMLVAFTKTADPQVVILTLVLTFVLLRAVWIPHGYSTATISLASLLIAVPVTFVCSAAEETTWGGRFFWRACLQNGAVSVTAWYLIMPKVFEKWPHLLNDDILAAHHEALQDRLTVVDVEQRKRLDDHLRAAFHDPQGKK